MSSEIQEKFELFFKKFEPYQNSVMMVVLDRRIEWKQHFWWYENIGGYRGIKRTKWVKWGVEWVLKTELGDEATSTVSQTATAKNTITTALTFKRYKNECLKQGTHPLCDIDKTSILQKVKKFAWQVKINVVL